MKNTKEKQTELRELKKEFEKKFGNPSVLVEALEIKGKVIKHKRRYVWDWLEPKLQEREEVKVTGETSDGYHTFNELYEFRKLYNAALFNEWAWQGKYNIHKSRRHSDGELCFGGGWFVVQATLPTGQITNHYEDKDWDLFECEVKDKADEWDGHTAQDVAIRLNEFITLKK